MEIKTAKNQNNNCALSIIVPVGPKDNSWKDLLSDLKSFGPDVEVLLVAVDPEPDEIQSVWQKQFVARLIWLQSRQGRALQQNRGAMNASGRHFLFLHADSKLPRATIKLITDQIKKDQLGVFHFDLKFLNDGPKLVVINSVLAKARAKFLKSPLGNQGLLCLRQVFERIGGFQENVEVGEEIAFIWEAKRHRIPI